MFGKGDLMYNRINIKTIDDLFVELQDRENKGVFFYSLNGYNDKVYKLIKRYYLSAVKNGVIIENSLKNPDNSNILFFKEQLGDDFIPEVDFIDSKLKKWLPRANENCRQGIAASIYNTLMLMRSKGKNDNILKNAYIKFMCWLYYKFERVVNSLDGKHSVRILYEGECGSYQMMFLNVLSSAGCDILIIHYDSQAVECSELRIGDMKPFPEDLSLRRIYQEINDDMAIRRLYENELKISNCTNAWITGKIFEDVRKAANERGNDHNVFYNCFCRINGVEDKSQYLNDLYQLQLEMKNSGRNVLIINGVIPPPDPEEIQVIQRGNYQNAVQAICSLSVNIRTSYSKDMQNIVIKAFADIMLEESRKPDVSLNRLVNIGVYLLCWLRKYQHTLFGEEKNNSIPCFMYMGGCRNNNEALFCRLLARLPVDVLIFCPDLSKKCCMSDELLYEINNVQSLEVDEYPQDNSYLRVGTVAYHAERDLDTIMYNGCGIYRNQQYSKANSITLQTMYEEIELLWNQQLTYRPGFSIVGDTANIPVIFSKISGVKDGNITAYWSSIKKLLNDNTRLITSVPCVTRDDPNPISPYAVDFVRNGVLCREKIRSHKAYQYGYLRGPVQDYILDKMQELINSGIIAGVGKNGTEYTIISTILNLDKQILRMIQGFDFTKNNPKLVYVITGEKTLSLEDTIQIVFLNMIGFDIVFFVPTGYRCIETYLAKNILEEHQIGGYIYDLQPPDFSRIQGGQGQSFLEKLFNHKR